MVGDAVSDLALKRELMAFFRPWMNREDAERAATPKGMTSVSKSLLLGWKDELDDTGARKETILV